MRSVIIGMSAVLSACTSLSNRPARSVAQVGIAFDGKGQIASFAEGFADRKARRHATIEDPVRVASISKMVTAIGALQLVDAGKLDLTSDVSRWLGWNLRNPYFPERPITLSMLLSHTASVREHDDDYVIPLGSTLEAVMKDRSNWDPNHGPGDGYFSYVNLNYPIIGSIIEKATGERFDIWMHQHVLAPMNLDACFNWSTCSQFAVTRAVELDGPDGKPLKDDLHGSRPACPVFVNEGQQCDLSHWRAGENGALFAPQGGLRISAVGLARIGRMLLSGGILDGVRILSPAAVRTLFAQVWHFDGSNGETDGGFFCSAGNGTHQFPNIRAGCADDLGSNGNILVGHAGDAYGMKSGLWLDPRRGVGIAYFVTGVADGAPKAAGTAYTAAEAQLFRRTYALLPR